MMITPEYLKKGDKIAFVAAARKISPKEIESAKIWFESLGFEVIVNSGLFDVDHQMAGSDEHRTFELQRMLDDESIRAIIAVRGGYGTVRIVDKLDFTKYVSHPKWIIGFSDITVLHSHIQQNYGIETLHAIMPFNFINNNLTIESLDSLESALTGKTIEYEYPNTLPYREGSANGVICGGNLSVINSLAGSISDIETHDKILFIEDLDEYIYHIDRMMVRMKRSGMLAGLSGLIVGGMTEMKDNTIPFGKTIPEIIMQAVNGYNYPVCFGFPAGHMDDNRAIILGRETQLTVNDKVIFKQSKK